MSKLAYLGPRGTNSEEAARFILKNILDKATNEVELAPFTSIYETMMAVDKGFVDACLVPVENSIEGSVRITLDTLAHDVDLDVNAELVWSVHNQLLVAKGTTDIHTVISHEQPLAQCRSYLQEHYPKAKLVAVRSTAKAAEMVSAAGAGYAAIATLAAAELYDLEVRQRDIQDISANYTRFILLTKRGNQAESVKAFTSLKQEKIGNEKLMLICQINGRAGSLYDLLGEFASRKINMTRIESRPARTTIGEYIFFMEIEPIDDLRVIKEGLAAIEKRCLWVKNLGIFPTKAAEGYVA